MVQLEKDEELYILDICDMPSIQYCKDCGAPLIKNRRTGKIYCRVMQMKKMDKCIFCGNKVLLSDNLLVNLKEKKTKKFYIAHINCWNAYKEVVKLNLFTEIFIKQFEIKYESDYRDFLSEEVLLQSIRLYAPGAKSVNIKEIKN